MTDTSSIFLRLRFAVVAIFGCVIVATTTAMPWKDDENLWQIRGEGLGDDANRVAFALIFLAIAGAVAAASGHPVVCWIASFTALVTLIVEWIMSVQIRERGSSEFSDASYGISVAMVASAILMLILAIGGGLMLNEKRR